jgi:nicotinamide mononucleotide (NMN) deamidase PncC
VGTVWISALHRDGRSLDRLFRFTGGRDLIRRRSAVAALLAVECLLAGLELPPVFPAGGRTAGEA